MRAALAVLLAACTPVFGADTPSTCPAPFSSDPARESRLEAILSADLEARAATKGLQSPCFGTVKSAGVLVDGRPMLDARASDVELAARLAHLGVHVLDDIGDGCKRGRAAASASEERARALETRLRERAGLGPSRDDAKESVADYAARCPSP